jgi:hypothetical protein
MKNTILSLFVLTLFGLGVSAPLHATTHDPGCTEINDGPRSGAQPPAGEDPAPASRPAGTSQT